MSSGAELSKPNNRAAALAQLKFKRKKDVQTPSAPPPVSVTPAPPPETPRVGRVLVPDSSPLAPHNQKPSGTDAWSRLADDGLSAPSFSSSSKYFPTPNDVIDVEVDSDGDRPRKKPRPDFERLRSCSTRSDVSSSLPPSSRVSTVSTPTPVPEDPSSPVVGKLRKDVSKVKVDAESDEEDQPPRRRLVRGRKQVEDDDLPSPKSLMKRTLEDENDEREGIIDLADTPPPSKYVNGKPVNGTHKNGSTSTKQNTKPSNPKPAEEKDGNVSSGTEFDADGDDSEPEGEWVGDAETQRLENEALVWFNIAPEEALVEVTACTPAQASLIASLRPFPDVPSLKRSLKRAKGVTPRFFDDYVNMQRGYSDVDTVLAGFEEIGKQLGAIISEWTGGQNTGDDEAGLHLITVPLLSQPGPNDPPPTTTANSNPESMSYLIRNQPFLLAPGVVLKDYQLFGISWLNLLYKKQLSCILADEMGLGKTCQVVAFLAWLKGGCRDLGEDDVEVVGERAKGVHLVVVPSSTLENWAREFAKFAPSIRVATYYGNQKDRAGFRDDYKRAVRRAERMGVEKDDVDPGWDVLITTYQIAQGAEPDRKFLSKSVKWETCVFDEGHVLKNFQSQRYQQLMKIPARWRLLLTGTPLQNNLQELVSLISFILPGKFNAETIESLRTIFKVRADAHTSLLSRERVSRAKTMMTPFVLRRRKDQVLKDLPNKTEKIVWCSMTALQRSIYHETMRRSKKELEREAAAAGAGSTPPPDKKRVKTDEAAKSQKKSATLKAKTKAAEASSAHVLMDLRKAASHPMLFRRRFDDGVIRKMAKLCLKEPEFMDSVEALVVEDMEVMTDAELQVFAKRYKSCRKLALTDECFLDAGKVEVLLELVGGYRKEGRRVLVFSQFTQILDILKVVLDHVGIKFLVLTGSTPVDERQSLVDEFTEDESIPVFLLSTRAGGMGINLTAASVVIMFDQDFNPHNDRQAADRSYRIGQKRDVDVVKLITKETIEEDILRLGQTKLALDEAVAGDAAAEEGSEGATEKAMKSSLLNVLRERFADETAGDSTST
ncbi:hypothetical protein RSOLAG22IIIB_00020 [Rhizoctonia solani]|uniref:ATP-dependent helicase fft2 n=1 Tax=Rhizoctonia solani TaxID=456999 RepID=A0A0K6FK01_9AGAM|nr:hypothetical protein RSOLAG22IIIB_00020 [Rhizoctonia solani]